MLKRILTSIIGLLVFFTVIFVHHYVLYAAVALLIFGMLYEMYRVMTAGRFLRITGYVSAAVMYAGYLFYHPIFALYASCMVIMLAMIAMHGKVSSKKVMAAGFAAVFIATFMVCLIMIRRKCDRYTVILPFVIAWLTDTGAYFTGTFFGKHKLAESISPKKTVEGAVGGVILAVIGCAAYIVIMVLTQAGAMPRTDVIIKFALLGLIGSVISQSGDLIASCIKRDFDKKDYGTLLPGHGGLLDRFDSVLFVIPFVYYMMLHVIL